MNNNHLYAETAIQKGPAKAGPPEGPLADGLLIQVMVIILVIWAGIAAYLVRIAGKVKKMERELDEH
jgi:CcmD family protein